MIYLKADTATEVLIGPAVAVGDGFVPVTTLVLTSADEAELIKYNGATTLTGAAITNALAALTSAVDGYYSLELTAGELDTEGPLWLVIQDDSLILPIRQEYMVVNANVYDSLFAVVATDLLQVDVREQVDTTVPTPTTAGVPDVNVERWLDTLVTLSASAPDVNIQSTDDIDLSATQKTSVNTEVDTALTDINLDHFVGTASGIPALPAGTYLDLLQDDGTAVYSRTTDSMQAIRDHIGDGTNLAEAGGTGDHLTAIDLPNQTMDIVGNITGNLSGSIGSVTGNVTGSVGSNLELGPTEVNAEVVDVLFTDTDAEPVKGPPGATISIADKIGFLYKAWRNRSTQTATLYNVYNDDATTIDHDATVSDDATTADRGEMTDGP